MVIVLVVESLPNMEPVELQFDAEDLVSLGRDPSSHVQLPHPSVSLQHALIRPGKGGHVLVDQQSTNGTFLNSEQLGSGAAASIADGDAIRLGRAQLRVRLLARSKAPRQGFSTQDLALAMVEGSLIEAGSQVAPRLRVVEGPDRGARLTLDEERTYTIGRDPACDLRVLDDDASRRHASVVRRGSRLWAMDLGSLNGSRLDGRALEPNVAVLWSDTSVLDLGATQICIEDPVSSALRQLESEPDALVPAARSGLEPSKRTLSRSVQPRLATPSSALSFGDTAPFTGVSDIKGTLKLSTSSSSSAPSAPIEVLQTRNTEPPGRLERVRRRWTTLDALVVSVAGLTIAISALALAWFLVN